MSFKSDAKQVMNLLKTELNGEVDTFSEKNDINEIVMYGVVAQDDIWPGTRTVTSIGLSTVDTGYVYDNKPLAIELIGVVLDRYGEYGNVLGSIVTNTKSFGRPSVGDSVHEGVISMYYPDVTMKHVVLSQSVYWDGLYALDVGDKIITWLMPMPISDSELEYLNEYGVDALLTLFEEKEVFIADLNRPATV